MAQNYLTPMEARQYVHRTYNITYSIAYFAKLRSTGGGAYHFKHGSRVYYTEKDLDQWVLGRTHKRRTTSEIPPCANPIMCQRKKIHRKPKPASGSRDLDIFELLAGNPG